MKLAPNEEIIKEWHYASRKTKAEKLDCSLVLTNKRIISARQGGLTNTRDEIRTNDVCAVHAASVMQSIITAIVLLALSAVALIAGGIMACMQPESSDMMDENVLLPIIGVMLLIVGAFLLIIGLYLLLTAGCKMEVLLFTKTLANPGIAISQNAIRGRRKPRNKVVKVKVNKEIAKEVVEELGVILLCK